MRLFCPEVKTKVMPFDAILPAVAAGEVEAGLIIHEGQLTYSQSGLHLVIDLGKWWYEQTHGLSGGGNAQSHGLSEPANADSRAQGSAPSDGGLPLPLGVNAVRRDLGEATCATLSKILLESIRCSLAHRAESLRHALSYSRGLESETADRFVGMYVNELTLDMGPRGLAGLEEFFARGQKAGLIPPALPVRVV